MNEWAQFAIFMVTMFSIAGVVFYLGYYLGRELEKEKWINLLTKGSSKKMSDRWTTVLNIHYPITGKKNVEPRIFLAVNSMKPSGAGAEKKEDAKKENDKPTK